VIPFSLSYLAAGGSDWLAQAGDAERGLSASTPPLLPKAVNRGFQAFDQFRHLGNLAVGERAEQLVFKDNHGVSYPVHGITSRRGQVQLLGPAILEILRPFDQSFGCQCVEKTHQGWAFYADGCGQVLLADAVAKVMQVQERTPGRIGQSGRLKFIVQDLAPAPREDSEVIEKVAVANG